MLDQTALSVLFFSALKLVLWIGIILYTIAIVRRIANSTEKATIEAVGRAVHTNMRSVVMLVVAFVVTVVVTGIETAYRPKTVIAPRNEFSERMRVQEGKPLPAMKDAPTRPSWDEVEKKNEAENEKSRREFETLSE